MNTGETLDKLFKEELVTLSGGRQVKLRKATLRTMRPVTALLTKLLEDLKLTADNIPSVDLNDPATILKLISSYYEDAITCLVAHAAIDQEELADLPLDDTIAIAQGVIVLNKSFFMTKVLPAIQNLRTTVEQAG